MGIIIGNTNTIGAKRKVLPPNLSDAFLWFDLIRSGETYVDNISGRIATITNRDYDLAVGFPYKSAATISAPIGDAAWIAADTEEFWYTSGTPNEIPVISFYQNIGYDDFNFNRHQPQILDGNSVETFEPRILDSVLYNNPQTGNDLINANNYFNVPTEETTNTKWIDPVNGNDGNAGTKALPYLTFATAIANVTTTGTIYVKTGDLNEICAITNKGVNVIGTGLVDNINASRGFTLRSTITDEITIKGLLNSGSTNLIIPGTGGVAAKVTVDKCNFGGISGSLINTGNLEIKNSYFDFQVLYKCPLIIADTNRILNYSADTFRLEEDLVSTNNEYINDAATWAFIWIGADTTSIESVGDSFVGRIFKEITTVNVVDVNINYCEARPDTTGLFILFGSLTSVININIGYSELINTYTPDANFIYKPNGDLIIHDSTLTDMTLIMNLIGQSGDLTCDFYNNTCISDKAQRIFTWDFEFEAYNNIMISDVYSAIYNSVVDYNSISLIHDNFMASKLGAAPFILLGTEYSTAIDGMMNGSKVYNNRFSGPTDYGNDPDSMHGVFVWSQAAEWYNNYLSGSNLGFVAKSNGGTYDNRFHHNLVEDTAMSYTIKGIKGSKIYNNVSKNASFYDGLPEIQAGVEGDSGNSTIKNNIAVGPVKYLAFDNADQLIGLVSDNNVFYYDANEDVFRVDVTLYNLAEWQALGYDANSVFQDALLNSSLVPQSGSPAIGIGEDLGNDYKTGLDESTDWGNETTLPSIVTKDQVAPWDGGAFTT